ncbi:hypothetical protein GEMRC1_009034 [Eukaryota sp. GEM-RC1]
MLSRRPEITHVVIMDDDVQIPSDMSWQSHLMEEEDVAGAVITIRTDMNRPHLKRSSRRRSLLVWFQDMEYMISGLMKQCQSTFGTAAYPHAQMGFILREKFKKPLRLVTMAATPVLTFPPTELFHVGEDFFGDHVVDEKVYLINVSNPGMPVLTDFSPNTLNIF